MQVLSPLIFISLAIALFFGYTSDAYHSDLALTAQKNAYNEALGKSIELEQLRRALEDKYNNQFALSDIGRLEKALPDTVNNVRLVIDINSIALAYGLVIRNISLEGDKGTVIPPGQSSPGKSKGGYNEVTLRFSVASSYENFMKFINDLERSLRVVDVEEITFQGSDKDMFQYNVLLKTYWLNK